MYSGRHSGQPNTPRPPGQAQFNGPMSVVSESCERIKKEFEALQAANHSLRVELEKVHAEKNENHKHLVMYYDMSYGLHVDKVRHKEIVRRLDGLIISILPMLSSDQQGHIATALDRAKTITPDELNNILRDQSGDLGYGGGGPAEMHPSMNNMPNLGRPLPGTPNLPGLPNLPVHGPPSNIPHNLPPHSLPPHGPPMPIMPPQSLMQPGLNMSSPPNTAGLLTMSGPPSMPNMAPSGLLGGLPGGPLPPLQPGGPMQLKDNNNPSTCRAASRSSATSDRDQRDHHHNSESKSSSHHNSNSNKKHRRTEENIHINNNSSSLSDDDRSEDLVVDGNDDRVDCKPDRNFLPRDTVLVPCGADGFIGPNGNTLPFGVINEPYTMYRDSEGRYKSIPATSRALNEHNIPKFARERTTLLHGEVVCAVALSNPTRNVYTGGRGYVKVWTLEIPDSNNGHCSPSVIHEPVANIPCLSDENYVRSCKLLPGGKKLIVGGETPPISVWDLANGGPKQIGNLQELATACYALAISPDSKICISCFSDGTVGLYDIHNLQLISSFTGHVDGASCADISSDGNTFFTGGLDYFLKSWNLNSNKVIGESDYITKTKFSSQIFSLGCCPSGEYTAVGMEDSIVEVMNIKKKQEKLQLKMHDSCVLALKFATSGKWFMTTGKDRLLNICGAPEQGSPLLMKFQESSSVLSCDISGDDRFFATGSGDKKATVYEVSY